MTSPKVVYSRDRVLDVAAEAGALTRGTLGVTRRRAPYIGPRTFAL